MYKIELSNEIEQKHLNYFKNKIVPNFDNNKIDFSNLTRKEIIRVFGKSLSDNKSDAIKLIEDQHLKFMSYCKTEYANLAIGKPKVLREFIKNTETNYGLIFGMLQKGLCLKTGKKKSDSYNDKLLKIFGYSTFGSTYNYNPNDTKNWSAYHFVFMSNVRVCPYCNRQYITPIYSKDGKVRADLDHFYPKSKYPYLSMSIYNLVPSCKFCNSSLKGKKEFAFEDINPYESSYDDYFKFYIDAIDFGIQIDKTSDVNNTTSNYLNMFKIEKLYDYHSNQAKELLEKRNIYSDTYITSLFKENRELFDSEDEVRQLIIGYVQDRSKINNEAFLKLRRDIAEQLGFIKSKQDQTDIEKLKVILNK